MIKTFSALAAAAAFAWVGMAHAQETTAQSRIPVENLQWFDTGIGLQGAIAYGDMATGPYGVFLKFPSGFDGPAHHHSSEYRAVVIAGTLINSEAGEADIMMRPGSYWYQRANINHGHRCVSSTGCTVYLTQPGMFDFLPEQSR